MEERRDGTENGKQNSIGAMSHPKGWNPFMEENGIEIVSESAERVVLRAVPSKKQRNPYGQACLFLCSPTVWRYILSNLSRHYCMSWSIYVQWRFYRLVHSSIFLR